MWTDLFGLELFRCSFDHLGEELVGLDLFARSKVHTMAKFWFISFSTAFLYFRYSSGFSANSFFCFSVSAMNLVSPSESSPPPFFSRLMEITYSRCLHHSPLQRSRQTLK